MSRPRFAQVHASKGVALFKNPQRVLRGPFITSSYCIIRVKTVSCSLVTYRKFQMSVSLLDVPRKYSTL
jgi:hypothetical protein